jgi:hypothetical protein
MKKKYALLVLVFIVQFSFSQKKTKTLNDTIGLKEVVVIKKASNKKDIEEIIKKIKRTLKENYNQGSVNYIIKHFVLKDDKDTLRNKIVQNDLNIKAFSKDNISWMLIDDPLNSFDSDTTPFQKFEPLATEDHWFALSVYYDSLKVIDFDFFNDISNFKYHISVDNDITVVSFTSYKYYKGYFSFNNKNNNLRRIAFMNTRPYDYQIFGYQGGEQSLEFFSNWTYNKVTVKLDFGETDNGKLLLTNLDAMQEMTNFRFKRYLNPNIVLANGFGLKFYSTLKMKMIN